MIRIHTLGGLSVRGEADGQPLSGSAAQPRRMAVLALLARSGSRGLSREKLQATLWPDADDERGRRTLAQALYALRQDLGSDKAISGTSDLRLDPEFVSSDVADFSAAVSRGDETRAASVYEGAFLDGFHLPGLAEFERWMDAERRALAQDFSRVLESLARDAQHRGDVPAATTWWRKLASLDPLNARYAIGLMNALVASGDRAGALRHARVYEVLLEQELELAPDREVVLLAERLRREGSDPVSAPADALVAVPPTAPVAPVAPTNAAVVPPHVELDSVATDTPEGAPPVVRDVAPPPASRSSRRNAAWITALLAGGALVGAAFTFWWARHQPSNTSSADRIVAVGRIGEYTTAGSVAPVGAPLGDLLATNLARIPGLRVVSPARMLELEHQGNAANDSGAGGVIKAARDAGATELVDGTVFRKSATVLRLDLRRIDLQSGSIVESRTVEGTDLFALVDSGTARLAASLGATAPAGSVTSVTTHSDAAYQLYVQGLDRYFDLDWRTAERLFAASLAADSTFAMAAYYLSLSTDNPQVAAERIAHAVRLSGAASERERLIIRADAAMRMSSPALAAITDTLALHFPDEVETQLYRGESLMLGEDYAAAIAPLQRVIAMDSLVQRKSPDAGVGLQSRKSGAVDTEQVKAARATCYACAAFGNLVYAYIALDSLHAAERETRRWTRLFPLSPTAWMLLSRVLTANGHADEGVSSYRTAVGKIASASEGAPVVLAINLLVQGDYERATSDLRAITVSGTESAQAEAHWYLAIAEREQGHLTQAYAESEKNCAQQPRAAQATRTGRPCLSLLNALMLDELGRHRDAASMFDTLARVHHPGFASSTIARTRVWALTHAATALAGAGDTGKLSALADTVRVYGTQSALYRDQQLHHYVRGLLEIARGHDDAAIAELQQTIRSRTTGFTRASYVLSQAYLRQRRARDAVVLLQPALHFEIEGSNLYVSRTELHAVLASAWEAAGGLDSASAHYAIVARTWANGDPPYRVRAERARTWIASHHAK